jgi:hypothetical protein
MAMKPRKIQAVVGPTVALMLVMSACGESTDEAAVATSEPSVQLEPRAFCEEWPEVIAFSESRDHQQPPKTLAEAESLFQRWQSLLDDAAAVAPPELDVPMETMQRLLADYAERSLEPFRDEAPRSAWIHRLDGVIGQ